MSAKKEEIAQRVRELRECRGLAVQTVSSRAGLTPAEYERMESGEVDFPASVLVEVALLLQSDLTELLTGRPAHSKIFTVTRAGAGVRVNRRADYGYESLASGFTHKKCEPFIVEVRKDHGLPHGNTHPGHEFNYVLQGRIRLHIHDQELILDTGDSVYFDSAYPHAMEALDDQPAKFLAIIL